MLVVEVVVVVEVEVVVVVVNNFNKTIMSNTTKTFITIIALILICAVPATIYFYFRMNNSVDVQVTGNNSIISDSISNSQLLTTDSNNLQKVANNSTEENINNYLDSYSENISSSETQYEKDILNLRKALVLTTNHTLDRAQNVREATDILVDLINNHQGNSDGDRYLRSFSLVALIRTHNLCCEDANSNSYLFSKEIKGFNSKYNTYINLGYSKGLAKMLSLNDLLDIVPYTNDSRHLSNVLDIKSRIILLYSDKISEQMKDNLLVTMKKHLDIPLSDYKAHTYEDPATVVFYPMAVQSRAFDVYHQYSKDITTAINTEIDRKYDNVANATVENLGIKDIDPVVVNEIKYYNMMSYLQSMYQRYGKNIDNKKEAEIVGKILKLINDSKEVKNLAYTSFHSNEYTTGALQGHVNFAKLRTKYPAIDTYLKSIKK